MWVIPLKYSETKWKAHELLKHFAVFRYIRWCPLSWNPNPNITMNNASLQMITQRLLYKLASGFKAICNNRFLPSQHLQNKNWSKSPGTKGVPSIYYMIKHNLKYNLYTTYVPCYYRNTNRFYLPSAIKPKHSRYIVEHYREFRVINIMAVELNRCWSYGRYGYLHTTP